MKVACFQQNQHSHLQSSTGNPSGFVSLVFYSHFPLLSELLCSQIHTLYQRKYWSAIILPALQLINSRDWLKSIAVHWVHSFALIIIIRYKKMTITDSQPTSTRTPVICEKRNHINTDSGIPDIAACCRTHHSQTFPTNPCWYFGTTWNALKLNEWLQHTFIADSFLFPDIHIPSCYL